MPDPPSPDLASFMEVDQQTLQQEAVEYQDALRRLNEDDTNFIAEVLAERGEKADDAEDFGDISDDDLPEEEDVIEMNGGDPPGLTDDTGTTNDIDIDDLFEGPGSPIPDEHGEHDAQDLASQDLHINGHQNVDSNEETLEQLRERNFPTLYEATNQDPSIPAPAENQAEFVKVLFPAFKEGAILNWNDLLPPKNAYFNLKVPQKEPKPVHPTKVSLEIAPDQEKSFRTAGPATSDKRKRVQEAEAKGLIAIVEESSDEGESKEDFDWEPPSRTELIGNKFTWTDLEILCDDWDARLNAPVKEIHTLEGDDENMDEWEREILGPSAKRRKVTHDDELDFMSKPRYKVPSFDDFERTVKLAGKTAILDPNDPHLLLDYIDCNAAPKRSNLGGNFKRSGNGSMAKKFSQRFNISNDEAYDALKENHQSKVRAALNNLTVEHSLPAIKLVHPYYKFKLDIAGARSFHRPGFKTKAVGANITFSRPGTRKRKDVKGMPTQEVFAESKDLTLGDHYATATLLEYSEEHPTVLSNFGMGNRIINYYRKKNADDNYRPPAKDYIGDSAILLPEDKSPFSNFGSVDPGETVPTLHNSMYRAPIFKHETKPTDFLVIRATTGIGGSNWHIRNIDNLFAVGQQFPMLEVPGPHARKVTNAAKCRMKMISFRKMRHHPKQEMKISEITAHIADSNDMQNRQKMKEFASYDKNDKVWKMKPGEQIPDETVIRAMVSPEDVCLIDAMQVGQQHLRDAGYAQDEIDDEDDTDNLEQNLAPWKTTKAFIDAAADKAMLRLHGEGDPSGCGLAFSFIKTSMKGGYMGAIQGPSATSADAIARERKANGGHTYNVRKQQAAYNDAIRDIWEKQKANLSDPTEHVENDLEREQADEDERLGVQTNGNTVAGHTGFDDSASQISRFSNNSHSQGRIMRIIRRVRNKVGNIEEIPEIVKDARVMREYQKRRAAIVASSMNVYEAKPTGDAEFDKKQAEEARKELIRLERNKERRHAREKQKGIYRASVDRETTTAASPASTPVPSIEKPTGTTRKCANCGQAGHIKTNKKLCPMLNGTMKAEDSTPNHGGFGAITAPSFT